MKFRAWNGDYFEFSEFNFKTGCLGCNFSTYVEIDTPQSFTGLQDCNGIDIYEGDVLHHKKQGYCVVRYGNKNLDYAGFTLVNDKGMTNTLQNSCIYAVVGNTHKNPELLNG